MSLLTIARQLVAPNPNTNTTTHRRRLRDARRKLVASARAILGRSPTATLDIDEKTVWECLRNTRRRRVIEEVAALEPGAVIEKRELAERLAEIESGGDFDYKERQAVYTSLHQSHLGKLDDAGIVHVKNERVVAPGPNCRGVAHIANIVQQEVDR